MFVTVMQPNWRSKYGKNCVSNDRYIIILMEPIHKVYIDKHKGKTTFDGIMR